MPNLRLVDITGPRVCWLCKLIYFASTYNIWRYETAVGHGYARDSHRHHDRASCTVWYKSKFTDKWCYIIVYLPRSNDWPQLAIFYAAKVVLTRCCVAYSHIQPWVSALSYTGTCRWYTLLHLLFFIVHQIHGLRLRYRLITCLSRHSKHERFIRGGMVSIAVDMWVLHDFRIPHFIFNGNLNWNCCLLGGWGFQNSFFARSKTPA